ncbi:glutathione S-transferase C-terminal-like protein [Dacryopinax primogenitus]|uniref:Glutathione S-transferase C-terminal-like protein n=1 Tax=Dacryopinax primogenitus (strain DJM 731) TaxID=1858805 RepID=M5FWA9_DACPD|nr:glutathione S-transferase C-terminal-like protein [Dacryopinax primogenitus]EJT97671.1 glutathione S-transferase C-terminal-like protein [Dacryopinax primogenitus]
MSHGKQFTLYAHRTAVNGYKVAIVLSELGLEYEMIYLDFDKKEHKAPEFVKYNPNGRIPALVDHANNDFVLWESNAILLYLVHRYDKGHNISAFTDADKALQDQWLFFQASGQGPYYGQWAWFVSAPEKIPLAIERYKKETERVLSVLDTVLTGQKWLVGDKMTIADISFIPWNDLAFHRILGPDYPLGETFPAMFKWHTAMMSHPAVKTNMEKRAELLKSA